LDPADLTDARHALGNAERAYAASADDRDVKTLAYVAERKSELADIKARNVLNTNEEKQAEMEIQQMSAQQTVSGQKLQEEQLRQREALEKLTQERGVTVREGPRGTIITMPGEVMFEVGKSDLRPPSRDRLNQVAEAVKATPDRDVVVQGFTDSTGKPEKNQVLSEQRAENVKDYLVTRGVPIQRIIARGLGEASPVASNATPEGRASNRRVEIIIAMPAEQQRTPQQQPMQQQRPQQQRP
jgi:outer membrane protein OmpA-like peptidoglycan-associated protein